VDTAILHGLDRVGDLDQFARCGFRVGVGAGSGEFHGRIESGCELPQSKTASSVSKACIDFAPAVVCVDNCPADYFLSAPNSGKTQCLSAISTMLTGSTFSHVIVAAVIHGVSGRPP
jgi:hypothetical protein